MKKKQIDDYLLNKMSADEREKFENRFFEDDDLFFEVAERENTLVDRYVNRDLSAEKRAAFEHALESLPARREKVSNARVLQDLIADNAPEELQTITIAERQGFLSYIKDLFTFGTPTFQFASVVVIALLALGSVLLLRDNSRLSSIEQQLAESRQRENELASQIGEERDASGDLTAELNAERDRREALEIELAKLRSSGSPNTNSMAGPTTIATLVLPAVGIKGGPSPVKRIELAKDVEKVSVLVNALSNVRPGDSLSATLNGTPLSHALRVRDKNGDLQVRLTVEKSQLLDGANSLTLKPQTGDPIEIKFAVSKQESSK
jgi:hypothetical protein